MASSFQTRGPLNARYKKLFKCIKVVRVSDPISMVLVFVARESLARFSVAGSNAPSSLPNWNEVDLL